MDDLNSNVTSIPQFTGTPGSKLPFSFTSSSSPVDYFQLFFDDDVIGLLTNRKAEEIIATKESAGELTQYGGVGVPSHHRR